MQTIILAAGKGVRFWPLTGDKPKPLLKILNKTILEHNLDQLNGLAKEVILVIGYQGQKIKNLIGANYKNLRIKYIHQPKQLGTGDAAKKAISPIKDKFLLLYGDDLYDKEDIKNCLKKFPSILLGRADDYSNFGVVSCQQDLVKDLIEKPEKSIGKRVNCGLYFLSKSIFNFKIKKSPRGEYEFTDYVREFIKREKLFFVEAKNWFPLSYPWNLLEANEFLLKKAKQYRVGKIEKDAKILGKVIIGKGTIVKSGSYLQGPIYLGENCQIGPNCYLKGPLTISSNCLIGQAVEIKNSIIGDNSKICHLNYVGDSIIGENCNLGAGTIIANLRFDGKTIKSMVNGKIIDTKRKKFGCIIGDNVKTGINVSLMPGRLIGTNCIIGPHSLIMENLKDNTIFFTKFQGVIKKENKLLFPPREEEIVPPAK